MSCASSWGCLPASAARGDDAVSSPSRQDGLRNSALSGWAAVTRPVASSTGSTRRTGNDALSSAHGRDPRRGRRHASGRLGSSWIRRLRDVSPSVNSHVPARGPCLHSRSKASRVPASEYEVLESALGESGRSDCPADEPGAPWRGSSRCPRHRAGRRPGARGPSRSFTNRRDALVYVGLDGAAEGLLANSRAGESARRRVARELCAHVRRHAPHRLSARALRARHLPACGACLWRPHRDRVALHARVIRRRRAPPRRQRRVPRAHAGVSPPRHRSGAGRDASVLPPRDPVDHDQERDQQRDYERCGVHSAPSCFGLARFPGPLSPGASHGGTEDIASCGDRPRTPGRVCEGGR